MAWAVSVLVKVRVKVNVNALVVAGPVAENVNALEPAKAKKMTLFQATRELDTCQHWLGVAQPCPDLWWEVTVCPESEWA